MLSAWRRLASKIREVGPAYAALLALRTLIPAPVFRLTRMAILEISCDDAGQLTTETRDDAIRWAGLADASALMSLGHSCEEVDRRLALGARVCLFAERMATIGYVWFDGRSHAESDLGVQFILGDGEIWLFDAMVKAEQRGRGIYPKLLRAASADLVREGFRRILIAIDTANHNSLRAHQSASAQRRGTVSALRILGLTIVSHAGGVHARWTGRNGWVTVHTSRVYR